MRWIKRGLWAVLALGLLLAVAASIYVQRSLPLLDGQLRLSVLKGPVEVKRDAADVTHILAQSPLDRRSMLIIATSFGVGLGIAAQPNLLHLMPTLVQNLFDSAITSGGLTAIVLCLLLPEAKATATAANLPRACSKKSAGALMSALTVYLRLVTRCATCRRVPRQAAHRGWSRRVTA